MRLNNQNHIVPSQTIRTVILPVFAVLFALAGVPNARATVWTRNQNYQCGHSPASITATYENQSNCSQALSPGMPIHIAHGISDLAANTTDAVTVKINLPPAFTATSAKIWKFPGGTSTVLSVGTLGSFSIGALGGDHVIVVIDGYFTQAGACSVPFVADRPTSTPAVTEGPPANLNIAVQNLHPPVDISIEKAVKAPGGSFGSTASVAFGTTVTYRLTVKNISAAQTNGSTDLYLGGLLRVTDQLSGTGTNDVPVVVKASNFQCTPSSGGVACPAMLSTSGPATLYGANVHNLPAMTYPTTGAGSDGFLPAGGSFVITFDVLITTTAACSPGQNNKLNNVASIVFSDGANTIIDTNGGNNSSNPPLTTVTLTGLPVSPCPSPTPIPSIKIEKKLLSPTTPAWNTPFTYLITITNNSNPPVTLTGLGLTDYLNSGGTPPFTASAPTNVICTPACTSAPATFAPLVNSGGWNSVLLTALFAPLAPGGVQTVQFTTQYPAVCAETTTAGLITNYAALTGPVTGLASWPTTMPALQKCDLAVSKDQTPLVPSFGSYPQTLNYHVQFKNISTTQTITVGTIIDSMALDSAAYGNVPITYSYTCTASTGVTGISPLTLPTTSKTIPAANPLWLGTKLIDFESSPGAVFPPGGIVDCNMTVTLQQPSTTDSLCQGAGSPHVRNSAFMALPYDGYNISLGSQPTWYQQVTTPLPYCVSILVGKTAPATANAGGPVTFTLTVTNTGKDPVSNVVLHDNVPADFTNVTWTCASGCGATSGSGNLNVPLNPPLAAGATVTVVIHATAPTELGTDCNDDKATFEPFPPLTYFEGDQAALTAAQACIQVVPPAGTPTPTASPRASATPSPAAGCADVSDKEIKCLPGGGYTYTFNVANNSGSAMSQILLTPLRGSSFTLTPQLTNLSTPLQNGQSTTVTTKIGNAKPGDKVCFFASLMSDKAACCIVQVCPTLPVCAVR